MFPDDGLREIGILRKESVSRVNGICAASLRCSDDRFAAQIRFSGTGAANSYGNIGLANVGRVPIRIGIHGHRANAHELGGADYATSNFAAIGDE
jgi:hypothetical protein